MMQIASRNAMRTKRIEPLRSPIDGRDSSTLDDPDAWRAQNQAVNLVAPPRHCRRDLPSPSSVRTSPGPGPAGPSRMRTEGRVDLVHMWRHRTGLRYAFDVYRSLI
ncbi:hypothetical protein B296_00058307 [Ensete ventricosum]|uniref:Uncharacterized protein n=1 Tax=Ensete ventricosum TaxID=4639 RepID=A0A426X1J2_ENSVE|nr:hypothetical protein B296_00058307 [Ensete ventricosum]